MAFRHPDEILTAWQVVDVKACLGEADAAARKGAYAVGFVAYEAARAFGLPTREQVPGLPLVYLAIFRTPPIEATAPTADPSATPPTWAPTIDRDAYESAIQRIKNYIADGDTYQLNFTFRLRAPFRGDAEALFRNLVAAQQGTWSMFLDTGTHAICSASPELFFLAKADGSRAVR
jgi:para-aminobenzoate synthetase/4-amino-4-deoxychorismate lyase